MFKLKSGNVIEKLNKMDRKQAYTYGGIAVGLLVVLFLLTSFLGNAEDASFEDFTARGYDLADSPFMTDEAEEFLLASAYPDMQNNNAFTLYGPAERAAREAADAEQAQEEDSAETSSSTEYNEDLLDTSSGFSGGYSSGGYSRRGTGGGGSPTKVGQLGNASVNRASGSDTGATWGSPRLDTTPYQRNKVEKDPILNHRSRQDAKRALTQFASTSQAGARLKEGRTANMKRALQGGDIIGAQMNSDGTVDLSNVEGTKLDTSAPEPGSLDLDNLSDKLSQAADDANKKDDQDKQDNEKDFLDGLLQTLATKAIEGLANGLGNLVQRQFKAWSDDLSETRDLNRQAKNMFKESPMSTQTRDYLTTQYKDIFTNGNVGNCGPYNSTSQCWSWIASQGQTGVDETVKGFKRSYRTNQRGKNN